jgi:hypothetical protein
VGGEQFDPPQLTKLLADPEKFFPFIDEFGQYIHRDWPGKTHSPDDLAAARNEEEKDLAENPGPPNWDKYGGWQDGPTLEATGFFRTAKHEGKWWLVDPDGKLFFSAGITCVTDGETTSIVGRQRWFRDLPARDSQFAECYRSGGRRRSASASSQPTIFDFGRANIIRKYGQDWQPKFGAVSHQRLRSWGVNTIANWSSPTIYQRDETPYVVSLGTGRIKPLQGGGSRWAGIPDVFDADFKASLTRSLSRAADTAQDPWCIGYFVDNEMGWGADTMSLAVMTLACPPEQAAKKAFVEDLKAKYADVAKLNEAWGTQHASWEGLLESTEAPDPLKARQDLEAFHARIAQAYFRSVKEAIKEVAPHHLYLGCRFAPQNPPVVAAAAEYCDVVSLNVYYRTSLDDYELPVKADVPVMCTEFHYGALDRGVFHGGLTPVADQAARAAAYKEFLRSALRHPQFVGCHWFQYRDQCTTGRPLDEENYQIGFVDIADTPYPETIQAARQIGAAMYPYRLSGK